MGSPNIIKVGVLSSSRADYGIYLPLLKKLYADPFFVTEVIAFGPHLLEGYGRTVDAIYKDGFNVIEVPGTMSSRDLPVDVVHSMAATMRAFGDFYDKNQNDLIIALGDRYEMFSAVAATAPFNISVAHIHGGETTLGAIDNAFRHSITSFAKIHFTSHETYKKRVIQIIGGSDHVYNVGALSIDSLRQIQLIEISEFKDSYGIDLGKPTILFTFHPETIKFDRNRDHITEILNALKELDHYQVLVTMPNSDTLGLMIRDEIIKAKEKLPNMIIVESFGSLGYLSAMKHCSFMLGNTSSGFIEASFFSKPVINLGERQNGRIITPNILTIPINKRSIIQAVRKVERTDQIEVESIYGTGNAATSIINFLKEDISKLKEN